METKNKKRIICRFLKAKNSFGMLEGGDNNWFDIEDASTNFWCILTTGTSGPDNGPVSLQDCVERRKCFRI